MNSWNFIGRLARDGEIKSLNSGDPITSFTVALDVGYGQNKKSHFVRCSWFGQRGEKVVGYLKKGDQIAVTGEASMNTYTSNDGTEKSNLECRVIDVTLLGGKKDDRQSTPPRAGGSGYAMPSEDLDDSIPFVFYDTSDVIPNYKRLPR